ncbi:MAG: hypothetical protein PHS32_20945 [Rhodoferax sp.]|uniref:hypothetical protein n=1 Tax=Rhodoferax sp. TaxID=50421 RepID=UPI00263547E5|nr:hypothetical protein [Rhodoferax sp.]MDD5336211.1 hypothetical protein [Rhodoferax sp.]
MTFQEMTKTELKKVYAEEEARNGGPKGDAAYEHFKKMLDEGYKRNGFAGVLTEAAAFTARTTDLLISGGCSRQYSGKESAVVWCADMYNSDSAQQLKRLQRKVREEAKFRAEAIAKAPDKVAKPAKKAPAAKA